jgi:hypothetical protein
MLKLFIGGLRPHFYAICRPRPGNVGGTGYTNIYYTRNICTNESTRDVSMAMMSFPSGHCAAAFAGFGFLALWLNAKFKICADYKSRHWQLVLLATPICIAVLLSMSKVADYWHHWYDVLVGSLIGMFFAYVAYRQTYYSVFDWRYNHIPLPYTFTLDPAVVLTPPTRDLTCIDQEGWKNKWSSGEMFKEGKGTVQIDGAGDVDEVEDVEKGQAGLEVEMV